MDNKFFKSEIFGYLGAGGGGGASIIRLGPSWFTSTKSANTQIQISSQWRHNYMKENKPLYIAFIDFKQVFDTITHQDLFYKLLKSGIANQFYNII